MTIRGLTHGDDGVINKKTLYKGKISVGHAAGECGNSKKYPVASGYFKIMREITEDVKKGGKTFTVKKWIVDKVLQDKLERANSFEKGKPQTKTPRYMSILCFDTNPESMWESYLGMYTDGGLMCKSHGKGTTADRVRFTSNGERERFKQECPYKKCEDFIEGRCKQYGMMKVYPVEDPTPPNPYSLQTSSINTILSIENGLNDIYNLIKTSHMCRCIEANDSDLKFDGMLLAKLTLVHKKIQSGGKEVYITEVYASPELRKQLMGPITRMAAKKVEMSQKIGSAGNMSLLHGEAQKLLQNSVEKIEVPEQYEVEGQTSITDEFSNKDEVETYHEFSGQTTDQSVEIDEDKIDTAKKSLLDDE